MAPVASALNFVSSSLLQVSGLASHQISVGGSSCKIKSDGSGVKTHASTTGGTGFIPG